jgi:SAM-dependent methyltransferase
MSSKDAAFTGSVPKIYEKYLVPLIFEHYAADLVKRLQARPPQRLLEMAAGTGVVTRALAAGLPQTEIVATDLNPAMLEEAKAVGARRPVEWKQADAMQLPFPDASFDAIVCQFGVMFFPDRAKAFAEARRVLKPGGSYIFNVWDKLADNDFPDVITTALASVFPSDPPRFLARAPYGYNDARAIEQDIADGGFRRKPKIDVVSTRSRASSAREPALGFCQGSPLRGEIEARKTPDLETATSAAAAAIEKKFGKGPVDGKIQALVVTISG